MAKIQFQRKIGGFNNFCLVSGRRTKQFSQVLPISRRGGRLPPGLCVRCQCESLTFVGLSRCSSLGDGQDKSRPRSATCPRSLAFPRPVAPQEAERLYLEGIEWDRRAVVLTTAGPPLPPFGMGVQMRLPNLHRHMSLSNAGMPSQRLQDGQKILWAIVTVEKHPSEISTF